jgi:mono/diheme cytochrome c family protein
MKPKANCANQMIVTIFNKLVFVMLVLTLFWSNFLIASSINNGREIYRLHCVMCHGINGKSVMAGATNFNRGQGLFQSDHSLLERIKSGKNACPAFRGILTDQKIFDVIAYIRTLN